MFTYLKNWLRSQHFSHNEDGRWQNVAELTSGRLLWHRHTKTYPFMTSASVPAVTTLRSSLSVNVFFVYNNFFLIACFVNSTLEVPFQISLVQGRIAKLSPLLNIFSLYTNIFRKGFYPDCVVSSGHGV
jgi:hypothetical protein